MNAERWSRVVALFDVLRELPPHEREARLHDQRPDDELRAEVKAMLAAFDADPGFLESPVDGRMAASAIHAEVSRSLEGRRLGAYRLVREIGRGGMGVVYEGIRDDREFERRVAIKLLVAGRDVPDLAVRFRGERRMLAGLDHPNIARLLDAGAASDGTLYTIMEFVEGKPIDAWCRDQQSSVRTRVEIILRVCEAVGYAHQNLIIHRDLKPANVLVTADAEPKLLDFGIATLLSRDDDRDGVTAMGMHAFTAAFASPEQIRGERVTAATDVYSLGVLLYVLLTEQSPYRLDGLSPAEMTRVVCETVPPVPSQVAAVRMVRALRGDVDNIVRKALQKSVADRYQSVAELSADLRAWLEGRPVSATPASVSYRARKLMLRHKLAVAGASALAVSVVAGTAATAWQARIARRERDKAEKRFIQVREFSRSLLFDVHDALRPLAGATEPRRLLLDRAVQFLDGLAADAGDDTALKLELVEGYRRLGSVQGRNSTDNVGDIAGARRSFDSAVRLADQVLSADPESAAALTAVAGAYSDLSTALVRTAAVDEAEQAHRQHREAVERLERRHAANPSIAASLAANYVELGFFRDGRGDFAGGKSLYEHAVRLYQALPPQVHEGSDVTRGHARALQRLGAKLIREGQLEAAEARYREALALDEALLARAPDDAEKQYSMTFSLTDLGFIARRRGDLPSSESLYARALRIRQAALDADPKNVRVLTGVASVQDYLSDVYRGQRRFDDALNAERAALATIEKRVAIAPADPGAVADRAEIQLNLAQLLLDVTESVPQTQPLLAEAGELLTRCSAVARRAENQAALAPGFLKTLAEQQVRLRRRAR